MFLLDLIADSVVGCGATFVLSALTLHLAQKFLLLIRISSGVGCWRSRVLVGSMTSTFPLSCSRRTPYEWISDLPGFPIGGEV
jgi:hypothetical protein